MNERIQWKFLIFMSLSIFYVVELKVQFSVLFNRNFQFFCQLSTLFNGKFTIFHVIKGEFRVFRCDKAPL